MKTHLWIVIIIVSGFLGFMMGYSVPPFMEVGFGQGGQEAAQQKDISEEDLMRQYEDLYKDEEESGQ